MAIRVTLAKPGRPDRHGASGPLTDVREYPILGTWQESTTEASGGEATVVDVRWVVLPPRARVEAQDVVTLYGRQYEIDGEPNPLDWEDGEREGIQIRLRRAVG